MHEAPTATDRTSAHARYRDRLARLQDDEALRDVLVSAGLPGDAGWRRTHGRFLPGGAPYATLLLEAADPQRLVSLACFVDESVPVGADRTTVRAPGLGWVRVDSFPSDAALTTLGTVWTPEAPCRVMRYRPGKRCTLRFDGPGGPTFVKVFADDSGAVLQEDARRLWRAARAGRLGFEMPEPLGWDATRRALSQKAVPGSPLLTRLGAATGGELAEGVEEAVALRGLVTVVFVCRDRVQAEAEVGRGVDRQHVVVAEQHRHAVARHQQLRRQRAIEGPERVLVLDRHARMEADRDARGRALTDPSEDQHIFVRRNAAEEGRGGEHRETHAASRRGQ